MSKTKGMQNIHVTFWKFTTQLNYDIVVLKWQSIANKLRSKNHKDRSLLVFNIIISIKIVWLQQNNILATSSENIRNESFISGQDGVVFHHRIKHSNNLSFSIANSLCTTMK